MMMISRHTFGLALAGVLAAAPLSAQPTEAAVYELRAVQVPPRPLNAAEMVEAMQAGYPPALRAARVSGSVRVSMIIGTDGVPRDTRVLESADTAFNAPTLAAVQTLRFHPGEVNGRPVNVRVDLPVHWQIAGEEAAQQADPAAAPVAVYEVSAVTERPRPLNVEALAARMDSVFPPARRPAGVTGRVLLEVVVGPDGAPRDIRVLDSSDSTFNAPSAAAAQGLRFRPATLNGQAVSVRTAVPVLWQAAPAGVHMEPSTPAPELGPVYELSQVTDQPRPLNVDVLLQELEIRYPKVLRDAGRDGTVQVRFVVSADGRTSNFQVTNTTDVLFNAPTVQALTKLTFRPGRLNGNPVAVWVELPIQWRVFLTGRKAEPWANSEW